MDEITNAVVNQLNEMILTLQGLAKASRNQDTAGVLENAADAVA